MRAQGLELPSLPGFQGGPGREPEARRWRRGCLRGPGLPQSRWRWARSRRRTRPWPWHPGP